MFSTGVATGSGLTELLLLKDNPSRPSPMLSIKALLTDLASSMDWFFTIKPPTLRWSVPTVPYAVL
jgi:hypothetical protein